MIPTKFDAISIGELEALVAEQARESRVLEFKRDQVGPKDEDKREFLADVSALANTLGGDVVFGVADEDGVASELKPISVAEPEKEILRLENVIRSGLEPRLPRCDVKWIPNSGVDGFIVVRVPRSWLAPHRVSFRDHSKFYGRSSTGKYPMDVQELRGAFGAGQQLAGRLHSFRTERISAIEADDAPVSVNEGAKLVLHIIPTSAFLDPISIQLDEEHTFRPIDASGFNHLHTLEGYATYSGPEESDSSRAYTLAFRNGIFEAVARIGVVRDSKKYLYPDSIEGGLLRSLNGYLKNLQRAGVEPPFYIALSLLDVRGYALFTSERDIYFQPRPLRRDRLLFPEIFCEDAPLHPEITLRPLFDLLWQAFGRAKSLSFDEQGKYMGNR